MLVTSEAVFLFAIVSYFVECFNTLKCDSAGVFLHPLLEVVERHKLPFAYVEGREVCPAQKVVGSGSGHVEVGLQVFCGKDIGKVIIHRILLCD